MGRRWWRRQNHLSRRCRRRGGYYLTRPGRRALLRNEPRRGKSGSESRSGRIIGRSCLSPVFRVATTTSTRTAPRRAALTCRDVDLPFRLWFRLRLRLRGVQREYGCVRGTDPCLTIPREALRGLPHLRPDVAIPPPLPVRRPLRVRAARRGLVRPFHSCPVGVANTHSFCFRFGSPQGDI